jgi:hypothetical protein
MFCLCIISHLIPAFCLCSPLSSSSLIIPVASSCPVSSHTLSHTTRGGAPRARRLVKMYFHLTRHLSSHSPILVSFVTQVGCHPDRPLFPSAFILVLSNRLTVAEYFILATHQPTPSFFPFFLRLSAFVFSEIPLSQYRIFILFTFSVIVSGDRRSSSGSFWSPDECWGGTDCG